MSDNAAAHGEHGHAISESEALPIPTLVMRGSVGGVLMGLANLVPGISGGTMLLAAGVYPTFISSIAELTTLRIKARPIIALGTIAGSAAVAILLLAGLMKTLVVEQRWIMYSLFIGLTLGGVPLVWRLARPASPGLWIGAAMSFGLMVLMGLGATGNGSDEASYVLLFLSGLAGASAMILPGVSGGYLLLLLGQYEPILGAVDMLKLGLLGSDTTGFDLNIVLEAMRVVVPVGIGVAVGVVGVSNLLRWLLDRFEKPTLGILLGLLLGSVVGLYPFQRPVAPEPGFVHRGQVLDAQEVAELKEKYWPVERFAPGGTQTAASLALILAGLGATLLVDRIGGGGDDEVGSA
jgi:putative membrane protein